LSGVRTGRRRRRDRRRSGDTKTGAEPFDSCASGVVGLFPKRHASAPDVDASGRRSTDRVASAAVQSDSDGDPTGHNANFPTGSIAGDDPPRIGSHRPRPSLQNRPPARTTAWTTRQSHSCTTPPDNGTMCAYGRRAPQMAAGLPSSLTGTRQSWRRSSYDGAVLDFHTLPDIHMLLSPIHAQRSLAIEYFVAWWLRCCRACASREPMISKLPRPGDQARRGASWPTSTTTAPQGRTGARFATHL
jgi:hypothetical protein